MIPDVNHEKYGKKKMIHNDGACGPKSFVFEQAQG